MQPAKSKKQIFTFLILVFLLSSVFYFLILHAADLRGGGGLYVRTLMWCPALAAFATLRLNRRSFSELGRRWGTYQFQSWLIPLLYTAITYAMVWATGLGGFGNPDFFKTASDTLGLHGSIWISLPLYILLAVCLA